MTLRRPFPFARLSALAVLSWLMAGPVDAAGCAPQVHDGWIRLSPAPTQVMLAGFGRIENPCATPAVVLGASSTDFADVSLHRSSVVDGVSRMRAVAHLPLAPGATAVFEPGALHLMLMQPSKAPKPGDHVRIEFRLQDGRSFTGDFTVRPE